jgi:Nucleotide-diphospho-sugar transferase
LVAQQVWFKDPLLFFHNESSPIYNNDAYFQDDGARSARFAPYAANSGFYYLRNNARTRNFMTQFVLAGDVILKTWSHQQAMISLLNEHMSVHGLRPKVLSRSIDGFPGGYHYHLPPHQNYFKLFFQGKKDPTIFHMSMFIELKIFVFSKLSFQTILPQS